MKVREPKPKDTDSLQAHIDWYATWGYSVESESQTETSALLVDGGFSTGWFIFSWIVPGPGAIIYVIYHHFIKRKRFVELHVEDGKVLRRIRDESGKRWARYAAIGLPVGFVLLIVLVRTL